MTAVATAPTIFTAPSPTALMEDGLSADLDSHPSGMSSS